MEAWRKKPSEGGLNEGERRLKYAIWTHEAREEFSTRYGCKILARFQRCGMCNAQDGSEDNLIEFKDGHILYDMNKILPLDKWKNKKLYGREEFSDIESDTNSDDNESSSSEDSEDGIIIIPKKKQKVQKKNNDVKKGKKKDLTIPKKKINRPRRKKSRKGRKPNVSNESKKINSNRRKKRKRTQTNSRESNINKKHLSTNIKKRKRNNKEDDEEKERKKKRFKAHKIPTGKRE